MNTILLMIPGIPVAKQRPRVTRRGLTFTPAKTVHYETYIKEIFAINYPNFEAFTGPVEINVRTYFPIPKGTSKKNRDAMEAGFIRRDKRPDCDNLLKIVADALNGLAYGDDAQITSAKIEKFYSNRPRVEVEIRFEQKKT